MTKRKQPTSKKAEAKRKKDEVPLKIPFKCENVESLLTCTFVKTSLEDKELEVLFRVTSTLGEEVLHLIQDSVISLDDVSTSVKSENPCKCSGCGKGGVTSRKILAFRVRVGEKNYKCFKCLMKSPPENDSRKKASLVAAGDRHPAESGDALDAVPADREKTLTTRNKTKRKRHQNREIVESENITIVTAKDENQRADNLDCRLYVDNQNKLVDSDTNTGRHTDSDGRLISSDGRAIDNGGRRTSSDGRAVDNDDRHTDNDGKHTDIDGRLISSDGKHTDIDGRLISSDGKHTDIDGRLISSDGKHTDIDGRLISSDGRDAGSDVEVEDNYDNGDDEDGLCDENIPKVAANTEDTSERDGEGKKKSCKQRHSQVCDICGKQLLNEKTLKSHMATHMAVMSHRCKVCSRKFTHIRYLKKHEKTHLKEKPYICEICGQRFKLKESLPKHMALHGEEKPFKCDICQKRFHLEEQLKKHINIHTEERKFICEHCGKRFRTQGSMKSHKATHDGPMKHGCDQCGKSYRSAWYLKIHKKTHSGENLIQCKDCNDWFIDPCYFKLHQKKFCKGRPLLCSECGKEFPHNQALQSHMGIHTGERPFDCNICGRAFAKSTLRSEHVKRHTLDNCFTCQYCKKGFINMKELKRHEKCHIRKKKKACLPESLKPGRSTLSVCRQEDSEMKDKDEGGSRETDIVEFLPGDQYMQMVQVETTPEDTSVPPGEAISVSCIRYISDSVIEHSDSSFQVTSDPPASLGHADHTGASTQVLSSRGGHITVHDPISITHVYSTSDHIPSSSSVQFSTPSLSIPRSSITDPSQSGIISTPDGEHLQQLQPITTSSNVSLAYENETSVQHLLQAAAIIKNYPSQY